MKTAITTLSAILLLNFTTLCAQGYEPLDLAKKLFGKESVAGIKQYITGEYSGHPNGQDLYEGTTTSFTVLMQNEKKAVVAMTILDSLGKGLDTYLYFKKDSTWKMSAFRSLAMTGILEEVKTAFEKLTTRQIDSIIEKSKKIKKNDYAMFKSREDYDFQLGNTRLILELDEHIIKHFRNNEAEFERIKNLALQQLEKEKMNEERSTALVEHLKMDYRKLFVSSVSAGGYELGNGINFLIGGMIDNTVGYLFVKDKKDLPQISDDGVIMIKEIGNGWYIYKTT